MRLQLATMLATTMTLLAGSAALADETGEPRANPQKPFDYSQLPGVYLRTATKQDKSCPAKFTLRADGRYERKSDSGKVEKGKGVAQPRGKDTNGQVFAVKSSGGRKYRINVLPTNEGRPGALIGFEVANGQGAICGYDKDGPASRALTGELAKDKIGKANPSKPSDPSQLFGAFVVGEGQNAECPLTFELHRNGRYERFSRAGKRESGTYQQQPRVKNEPNHILKLTPSKGKAYLIGVLIANEGPAGLLAGFPGKSGGAICGLGRVKKL